MFFKGQNHILAFIKQQVFFRICFQAAVVTNRRKVAKTYKNQNCPSIKVSNIRSENESNSCNVISLVGISDKIVL